MQSDAGKALKALNKHADSGIRKQAKAVISHWRTALVVRGGERGAGDASSKPVVFLFLLSSRGGQGRGGDRGRVSVPLFGKFVGVDTVGMDRLERPFLVEEGRGHGG